VIDCASVHHPSLPKPCPEPCRAVFACQRQKVFVGSLFLHFWLLFARSSRLCHFLSGGQLGRVSWLHTASGRVFPHKIPGTEQM